MITHSGNGSFDRLVLALLGDGISTSCDIDLSKPPFNLNFGSTFPDSFIIYMQDGIRPSNATLSSPGNSSILHFDFLTPLPAPNDGTASPRTQMELYLFYA